MSIEQTAFKKLLIGSALVMSSPLLMAQSFYKWVDQHGSTHYTTTPPPKNAKKLSKVDTYGHPQSSQVQATAAKPATPTSPPATPTNTPDQQQQEANAALEQGRQRR